MQDEYSLNRYLTFNAGVRYDYYSSFGDVITPRAGVVFTPFANSSIKLLFGRGFRAPNHFELFAVEPVEGDDVPTELLNPETLSSLELIFEQHFNKQVRGELNFFHNEMRNMTTFGATANLIENQKVGCVNSDGIEAQLEGHWSNGFQARLSYSWQTTKNIVTDERLTNSPHHMVKLNLIAPFWHDKLFAGFETQYLSHRLSTRRTLIEGYVVNNITLFSQNWIKGLELSGGIYNLFDQRYFDSGSGLHVQDMLERDRLTFRVKLSMDF